MNKSRLDVIDTNVQQAHERKILKYLLLILVITVVYEGVSAFQFPASPLEDAVTGETRPTRLHTARLDDLEEELNNLFRVHPELRAPAKPARQSLKTLRAAVKETPNMAVHQVELIRTCEQLWRFTHDPIWEKATAFAAVNRRMEVIFQHLRHRIPEEIIIPQLDFTPFRVEELPAPKRNIFAYERSGEQR